MRRGDMLKFRGKPDRPRLRALPEAAAPGSDEKVVSDEDVVLGLIAGEEWAAEALYDRVHRVVDRTLRRLIRTSESDYEDLVQMTFERVIRTLVEQRFRGACSLSTWAAAIASRVGIDAFRNSLRARGIFDEERRSDIRGPALDQSLERQLEARSEVEQLRAILAVMDPAQAETVVLHDLFGHELSEISVLMGVSVAAAQSRLVRGRKDLLRRAELRSRR
jgi:RNA polymerase sigma-70 factor, ECF subfamily